MVSPILFLIDECLSPELANLPLSAKVEVTHVNFRGLAESGDPKLAKWCVEHDHAFVTNNAKDFRPIYSRLELHPGLVILIPNVDLDRQTRLFKLVISEIETIGDLVNKLVEIDLDGKVTVSDFPHMEA